MNWLVMLAGGRGERFWPLSRRAAPKQFLRLLSERSLLQETRDRVGALIDDERVLVVTGADYRSLVADQLPSLAAERILGEPEGRGTAASVAWAAAYVARQDPDGVLVVLPSDHAVRDVAGFRDRLGAALDHARREQQMTLFGIVPDRPDTGFGYIEAGASIRGDARGVVRFVEKPGLDQAVEMLSTGRYWWNSGMFILPLVPLREAFQAMLPETWEAAQDLVTGRGADRFLALPTVALDVGIMEPWGDRLAVLPLQVGWDDVGTFQAVARLLADRTRSRAVLERCTNVVVVGDDGPLVAGIGLQNLVVVRTPDVVLILPPEEAQAVRALLKRVGEEEGSAWL